MGDAMSDAEIVTGPLTATGAGICYSEAQLASWASRYSRMKPIEPGDTCCNCGLPCDDVAGFSDGISRAYAVRINGHPICARGKCYWAHLDEFSGKRHGCRCGRRKT